MTNWHRLEILVQNHQRASGVEADTSYLTPLHTLRNFLEKIFNFFLKYYTENMTSLCVFIMNAGVDVIILSEMSPD